MIPFTAPLDDILFSLNHAARNSRTCPTGMRSLPPKSPATSRPLLKARSRPSMKRVTARVAHLENGQVRMPDGFTEAYQALADGGWQGLTAPEAFGGMAQDSLSSPVPSPRSSAALTMPCR